MTGGRLILGYHWRRAVGALVVLVLWHGSVRVATAQLPPPPVLNAAVNDFAHVIDADSQRELDRRIKALKDATGDVVIVATVPTYQPYADIKEYAVKMFENRGQGIGDRAKDNGLLIVVAVNDRKVGIEVGYQLEPFITDGFSGQTIRETIAPAFRRGAYGEGLVAATSRIISRIAEQRGVNLTDMPAAPRPETTRRRSERHFPVVLAVVIFFVIMRAFAGRTRRRRRHWGGGPWSGWNSGVGPFGGGSFGGFGGGFGGFGGGGGGGGGGFGGFGGGRSGGGGASGGW